MNSKDLDMLVRYYRGVRTTDPLKFKEAMGEYRNMAAGGDGGPSGFPMTLGHSNSLRQKFYRGYPDWVFWTVLQELDELGPLADREPVDV